MFRNQYDSDVTTWSPDGRLHQVEYAMEAVKQGSATVGLKSKDLAVLVALKRAPSELAAYQKKVIPLDVHVGVSFAGLTADAKRLSQWMRLECLNSRFATANPMGVGKLISELGSKMQMGTQGYNNRPYGVGFLVAGFDHKGAHIYQVCPSAAFYDCRAMAIGARSQSARTYLEKLLDEFETCDQDQLVAHGLRALRDTLPSEINLNTKNVTVSIVGRDRELSIYDDDGVAPFLELIADEPHGRQGGQDQDEEGGSAAAQPSDASPEAGSVMDTE